MALLIYINQQSATAVVFSPTGEAVVLAHQQEHTLCIMDYPSLGVLDKPPAHVGGCIAMALDPRGR